MIGYKLPPIKPTTIIIIMIAILFMISIMGKQYKEYFVSSEFHVNFMSKYQTYTYIITDADGFIKNTPENHMNIYGYNDTDAYKQAAAATAVSFNDYEKQKLTVLALAVDEFLVEQYGLQQSDLSKVPWTFALTEGDVYEEGRPHVRGNIIFLSTKTTQAEIDNQCQFGFTLLYMRENMFFGNQVNTSTIPWNATDKNWQFAKRLPTCQFYSRINYYNDVYNSMYQNDDPNEYTLNQTDDTSNDQNAMPPTNLSAKRDNVNYYMNETQYEATFGSL